MFIFEILIYVVFAIIMSYFAKGSIFKYENSKKLDFYMGLYILFFCVIAALRWNTGSDSISYASILDGGFYDSNSTELLWIWFVRLVHSLGIHWTISFGILAFVQIYFITKPLREYKFILIMLPFVLFGGRYWGDLMGAVRQMIVGAGFVWASTFIFKREITKYFMFVFIASFIHRSALLLLPFYFISNIKILDKRYTLLIVLVICCLLGQNHAYQSAIGYLQLITNSIGLENYSQNVNDLLMTNTQKGMAFGPMMITYLLIPIYIISYGPSLNKKYGKQIPYLNLWYNLSYFYACGFFLVCNISYLFIRPMMYFVLFQMIMASLLLYYLLKDIKQEGISKLLTIFFCVVIFTNSAWDIYKVTGQKTDCVTYKVFFLHKEQMASFGL